MKIIDAFIFYNELDMLKYRLKVLNDVVDYFIIVESTHTHVGKQKPLIFSTNKELFNEYSNKIIHIIVDDFPHIHPNIDINKQEQWINEHYQRNCIKRGIDKLMLNDSDLIIISDVDEIPDPDTLSKLKNDVTNGFKVECLSFEQDMYYYNLNTLMLEKWYYAKIISYKTFANLAITCNDIRIAACPFIKQGGWHLSYFGDKYFIQNKIMNFGHQEFNNEKYTNLNKIEERMNSGIDLYEREHEGKFKRISLGKNEYLPPLYSIYFSKFILF
jgi:beta-1,4-mannosyl-glycoprotein beta-1,4-N-acetylglucosaminyltransferase